MHTLLSDITCEFCDAILIPKQTQFDHLGDYWTKTCSSKLDWRKFEEYIALDYFCGECQGSILIIANFETTPGRSRKPQRLENFNLLIAL